jgi:hypothetical protein
MRILYAYIFAAYEIIGALLGVFVLAISAASVTHVEKSVFYVLLGGLILFFLSMCSGLLLLYKRNYFLFFVNQCLQVISFSIKGLTVKYSSGIYLATGIKSSLEEGTYLSFSGSLSGYEFLYSSTTDMFYVIFNVIPILLLFLVFKKGLHKNKEAHILVST